MDKSKKGLSAKERQEYYNHWDDEGVKEEFFNHNINLIHYVCKKYSNMSFEYDDLFQSSAIGLWKAIKTFDPSKGFKFATYAIRVMDNEILMMIRKSKRQTIMDDKQILSLDTLISTDAEGNTLTMKDTIASSLLNLDDNIIGEDLNRVIDEYLSKISERDVEIIKMYMDGKKQKDIAQKYGIAQSYVSRIIIAVKRGLKEHLIKYWDEDFG